MNTNIKISDLKDKVSSVVVLAVAMVILVVVLGVASYFTIQQVAELKTSISSSSTQFGENKLLVASLEKLKADNAIAENAKGLVYDDDGVSFGYTKGEYTVTELYVSGGELKTVQSGSYPDMPETEYTLGGVIL